jgi:hypothetical protein
VHQGRSHAGHGQILRGSAGHLAIGEPRGHPHRAGDEEVGIYRGEVRAIMWKLADIDVNVEKILEYIEGDDDEWEEEAEEEDRPPDA